MEVDSTAAEVDSQLIAMFRSMGTTDRDQLLSQLRAIIGTGVDEKTCLFFLDLGHWNLHEAIGAYYDHYLQLQPPLAGSFGVSKTTSSSVRILSHHLESESGGRVLCAVLPSSPLLLRVFLERRGGEGSCRLRVRGSWSAEEESVEVAGLEKERVKEVVARLMSPHDSGRYELFLRVETAKGDAEEVRAPIVVEGQALEELEEQFMREVRTRPSDDCS